MNSEQRWRIFQIKPGKAQPVYIDPDDPKGIKAIREIIRRHDKEQAERGK